VKSNKSCWCFTVSIHFNWKLQWFVSRGTFFQWARLRSICPQPFLWRQTLHVPVTNLWCFNMKGDILDMSDSCDLHTWWTMKLNHSLWSDEVCSRANSEADDKASIFDGLQWGVYSGVNIVGFRNSLIMLYYLIHHYCCHSFCSFSLRVSFRWQLFLLKWQSCFQLVHTDER